MGIVDIEGGALIHRQGDQTVKIPWEKKIAGKDVKKETSFEGIIYPEGTLESLRPLLREAFATINDDEAYWAGLDARATLTPKVACNRLIRAGIGHVQAARALVLTDPLAKENRAWGNIGETEISAKTSEVAGILHPYFKRK